MDWKPNAHTIAGTGNRTRDSLVQSEELPAALTRFHISTSILSVENVNLESIILMKVTKL